MADVATSIRSYLLSKAAVTNLVGQRIYPDALKVNATMPAIVYQITYTERDHTISTCGRLAHARFQIDCYALTRATANAVASAVRTCGLMSYRGTEASIFINGVEIDTGEQYTQEPPTDGNQEHRYVTSFDLNVHYTEAD